MRIEFINLADAWVNEDEPIVVVESKILDADVIPQPLSHFFICIQEIQDIPGLKHRYL